MVQHKPPPAPNYLSCVAPSCLSLTHYHGRCGNVVLADAELTQVLSISPAWGQRHSTWPPHALLTLVMGTAILSTILGLSTPEGNDWQVPIPATGLLRRCTTCAHCTALAAQMTKAPYYETRTFHLVALVGLGRQMATADDNYNIQARDQPGFCHVFSLHTSDHHFPLTVAQAGGFRNPAGHAHRRSLTPKTAACPAGSCAVCFQRTGTDLAWV